MGMARGGYRQSDSSQNSRNRLAENRIMRLLTRLIKTLFTAEIMGLSLVLLALHLFINGITSSLRNTDTKYFLLACLIALLIGLGLSKRNSKPIQASVGIVVLGAVGTWILGARLSYPLINLLRS